MQNNWKTFPKNKMFRIWPHLDRQPLPLYKIGEEASFTFCSRSERRDDSHLRGDFVEVGEVYLISLSIESYFNFVLFLSTCGGYAHLYLRACIWLVMLLLLPAMGDRLWWAWQVALGVGVDTSLIVCVSSFWALGLLGFAFEGQFCMDRALPTGCLVSCAVL